ncbi:HMG box-containing protein 1 [Pleodorina starrii]|uniref:HMG box-containing protein 1 n=1 Tax=Pleodorina starrii TaxID=330485 RepID=A0A9W6BRX5_9CHLO|nr:HMG box-containing protein 1 [Pleodorina starrii]GLC57107.1 HMG box-containing protein 1 [Pleodorina starrii]
MAPLAAGAAGAAVAPTAAVELPRGGAAPHAGHQESGDGLHQYAAVMMAAAASMGAGVSATAPRAPAGDVPHLWDAARFLAELARTAAVGGSSVGGSGSSDGGGGRKTVGGGGGGSSTAAQQAGATAAAAGVLMERQRGKDGHVAPGKAKQPPNAFMLFCAEKRMLAKETNGTKPWANGRESSVVLGRMWRELSLEQRAVYEKRHEALVRERAQQID